MKTFTDFSQSKILAKFLPVESADLYYLAKDDRGIEFFSNPSVKDGVCEDIDVPCWSLAALLSVIPKRIKEDYIFRIDVGVKDSSIWYDELSYGVNIDLPDITADSLVDACYEMIVELNKHNLI